MTTWRLPTLNVANYLAVNAQRFPERTAIFAGEHPALSYVICPWPGNGGGVSL